MALHQVQLLLRPKLNSPLEFVASPLPRSTLGTEIHGQQQQSEHWRLLSAHTSGDLVRPLLPVDEFEADASVFIMRYSFAPRAHVAPRNCFNFKPDQVGNRKTGERTANAFRSGRNQQQHQFRRSHTLRNMFSCSLNFRLCRNHLMHRIER